MPKLAVIGHFSTWLIVAWIGWLCWAAWQAVWYRRLRSEAESAIASSVEAPPTPEPPAERSAALRAPGIALRTMTPAAAPRSVDQPPADAPAEPPADPSAPAVDATAAVKHDDHDDITPS